MINAGKRELLILRRKQSLRTQVQTAAELGISQANYCNIENGYFRPNEEVEKKLIAMFDLDADYFDEEDGSD